MAHDELTPLVILVVEDDLSHATLLHRAFKRSVRPCRLMDARTLREARKCLDSSPVDLILADYALPDGKGLELLGADPATQEYPVIVLTAFGDESLAVEVIKRGAMDYVVKTPEAMIAMPKTVERAMREWQLRFERREAHLELGNLRKEFEAMDRRLHEERARSNRLALQARSADVAKGAFLANITHEIRTPMNAVLGFSRLALELPDLPSSAKRYLATIESRGQDMLRIIDNAIDMARLEAGQFELAPTDFDVHLLVSDMLTSLKTKASAKGLALDAEVSPDIPRELIGDAARLGQALYNLLDNAVKFTEQGGVTLAVMPVKQGLKTDGQLTLRFEVCDTGPGIPEGKRSLLFGLFSRLDSDEMRRHGGLGLGLAVSKRLVECMGGEIGIADANGHGSIFYFTAPFVCAARTNPPVASDATNKTARILLAEDDPDSATLVMELLRKHGYSAHAQENGAAALQAFERGGFDLVIVDLRMPGMDGFDLARAIRAGEQGSTRHIPVVALTACLVSEEKERCAAAGMDACLAKPFREATLLEAISRCLAEKRHLAS